MIAINDLLILELSTKRALNTATITTTRVDTKHAQIAFKAPPKKKTIIEKKFKRSPLYRKGAHMRS